MKLLPVAFALLGLVFERNLVIPSVLLAFAVENQRVIPGLRHAAHIVRALHRREIDDKEQIISLRRRPSHKAEDAPVAVVRVHPFKSLIALVICVKGWIFPVHVQQIPHIGLQMLVLLVLQKEPVQFPLLAPLSVLSEILSHEQQLFARLAKHEGITDLKILELLILLSRHLVDHRAFQMNHFIM